jgi:hypothetical protein
MIGETGIGLYTAYAFICAFLVIVVVMIARLAFVMSLLWIAPVAALLRRLRRPGDADAVKKVTGAIGEERATGEERST